MLEPLTVCRSLCRIVRYLGSTLLNEEREGLVERTVVGRTVRGAVWCGARGALPGGVARDTGPGNLLESTLAAPLSVLKKDEGERQSSLDPLGCTTTSCAKTYESKAISGNQKGGTRNQKLRKTEELHCKNKTDSNNSSGQNKTDSNNSSGHSFCERMYFGKRHLGKG